MGCKRINAVGAALLASYWELAHHAATLVAK